MRKGSEAAKTLIKDAQKALKLATEAESVNRAEAVTDLQFSAGEQWPSSVLAARRIEHRPALVINKTDVFVRNIVNQMREQRPRIKIDPVGEGADQETAELLEGLTRHIEIDSDAGNAYNIAGDFQTRMGWGYLRVITEYENPKSFDQKLKIEQVKNPFTVYMDPLSHAPDGSDMEWCLITEMVGKDEFERLYPNAEFVSWKTTGTGDDNHMWMSERECRVAEYFRKEYRADKLLRLSNGQIVLQSEINQEEMETAGISISATRDTDIATIKWYKLTANEILEEREWPGQHIPIIPVYGAEVTINGRRILYGAVRNLRDPQRIYNQYRTAEVEIVGLAPKAPWVVAEGQLEGHEAQWTQANQRNFPYLQYKPVIMDGVAVPPPQRQSPQQVPEALVVAAQNASEDMKSVAGQFDPSLGAPGNETSGVMVQRRQQQGDRSNMHFFENLCRSIRRVGVILIDLIPHIYDAQRVVRIIGEDGKPKNVTLNEVKIDPETGAAKILNDVTRHGYGIVIDTGPGYATKRQEAADQMMQLLATPIGEKVGQVADDVIVRQLDWAGADQIADRLAAANPLAAQDVDQGLPEDTPESVKQIVVSQKAQLAQAQQQIQELQQHIQTKQTEGQTQLQIAHLKEVAATHRAELADKTKREDTQSRDATHIHEQHQRDQTALQIAQLEASVALLLAHMRDKQVEGREIANAMHRGLE